MTKPIGLLQDQCYHCKTQIQGPPTICQNCKVVEYCNETHKTSNHPTHSTECNSISESLKTLSAATKLLREDPSGNIFNSNSAFWSISETRPWRQATFTLIEQLREIPTVKACIASSTYGIEWLELNQGVDHNNLWHRVAALDLRLGGRDQEAYDFMKWYTTIGMMDPYYNWTSFHDLENEDVLEDLQAGNWICGGDVQHLSPMALVTLLKLRMWFDLKGLYNSRVLDGRLPREILDYIREEFIASGLVAASRHIIRDVRDGVDIERRYIWPLELQLDELFVAIEKKSVDFWPAIVNGTRFGELSDDSEDQFELVDALSSVHHAWEETPGAIEWVRRRLHRS